MLSHAFVDTMRIETKRYTLTNGGEALREPTKEERQAWRESERTFRRGYYFGVIATLQALRNGAQRRQLRAWLERDVYQWWHAPLEELDNHVTTPDLPPPWEPLRLEILQRDGYICAYCGGPADSVDHLVPLAKLGTDTPDNLVACCRSCNSKKGAR